MRKLVHLENTFGDGIKFLDTVSHEGAQHVHLCTGWILFVALLDYFFGDANIGMNSLNTIIQA
jgi:hypothetical protein